VARFGTPSTFTIQELSSQTGNAGANSLVLAGRALPHRPYRLSGEMRAESTWYPGRPAATLQMLGAKENESTIGGWWKDRFIKPTTDFGTTVQPSGIAEANGVQVADVMALAKFVDAIRRRGQLIEVTWDELTRQGYLRKFEQNWHRREDLEWEITFEWISQEKTLPPVGFHTQFSQSDLLANLQTALTSIQAAAIAPFQTIEAFNNAIDVATSQLSDAVDSIANASANIATAALSPVDAARRTLSALNSIVDGSNEIIDAVQNVPPLALINSPIDVLGEGDALLASSFGRGLIRSAQNSRSIAADNIDQFRVQAEQQDVIAVFTARDVQDLRSISTQFYGTQEEWKRIMQFNGLSTSQLTAGEVVFVPRLTTTGV
jgi:hypothetical protein